MLSIDFIRENREQVIEACKNKKRPADVDAILTMDDERKVLSTQAQKLREERNKLAKSKPDQESIKRGKELKEELQILESKLGEIEEKLNDALTYLPNVPLPEVPIGKDESENVIIKTVGTPPTFDFEPKSHIDLALDLDLMDLERGSKISGFRGYFLKNQLAILHMGLLFYVFRKLTEKGYVPIIAPSIVKLFAFFGAAQTPWGLQEIYKTNGDDAFLSGTAEVPVTAYHSGEVLKESELPKKYVAFSPCFRKEAGSYGKDTKGLYRVHEFWKIEQVVIGKADMDEARKVHAELQANCEEILTDLGLSFQVLLMCTGDMGEPQMLKYDTETWMPSRNGYGETMSNSIMGDFQARRLNIRYKTSTGETKYCYTFNNTALASPRILIALLENFQQSDGSIKIPEVLHSLCGFKSIEKK